MCSDPCTIRTHLRSLGNRWSREHGGAAVEFALIAPVLLLLFAGIGLFGICLGAAHNLRLVAAEAARASIGGVTDAERASLAQTTVSRSLSNGALFKPGSVTVQVGADPSDAAVTIITVKLDATTLGLGGFARLVPQIPALLTSSVSVRRGGL